ncbi:MAG: gliding motility-associated C-terminal domain-containing protein [Crocinitomicaceae bacterium]|nr:gliding motility-associated C-terminal domain-containing protein [Crocinitomicaceae bacterium]
MRSNFYVLSLVALLVSISARGQETFVHEVPFHTDVNQSMWGQGQNPNLNQTFDLFGPWSVGGPFDVGGCVSGPFGAGSFGIGLDGLFEIGLYCYLKIDDFTVGDIDVNYPIEVTAEAPANATYDQGDVIDITTSYVLDTGWYLNTYYPDPGTVELTLEVTIAMALTIESCFFVSLPDLPIIPAFSATIPINIVALDFTSGYSAEIFGIGAPLNIPPLFSASFGDTLYTEDYSNLDQYGITGWMTAPHVETNDVALGLDLQACGESRYLNLNLEIFDLLSNINHPVFTALGYLDYTLDVEIFQIHWSLFTANLAVGIINNQCFDFEPTVFGSYEFPVPIEYQLVDGATGALIGPSDVSAVIPFEVGNTIRMKYPCYFVEMDVEPTYSIDGQITSHTWDEVPLDFWYSGLAFDISWSDMTILPPIPALPYPCGINWCSSWGVPYPCGVQICWTDPFGGVTLYDIIGSGPLEFGPFIPLDSLNIVTVTYDWFGPETWSLDGFDEYSDYDPMNIQSSPLGVSNVFTDIDCHGDATGTIDVSFTALSPATPYTYEWSNGAITEDLSGLPAGPYELSAFDANGCQLFTGATIQHPDQPITIVGSSSDLSCNSGASDGTIDLLIQGGTPYILGAQPYTVTWNNGDVGAAINGLGLGIYSATVTDSLGCVETVTIEIFQPSALGQVASVTHANCNGDDSGAIEIDVFGGTQPYGYSWSSGQSTQDIGDLIAGDYTLTLSDTNGCTNIVTHTVTEPAAALQLAIAGVDILCKNDSTGSIDLTASGGTPGYSFLWSNSQGLVLPFQSEDIGNVPAEEYSVLVTDQKGCFETISITLAEPLAAISSNPVLTQINCNGDNTGIIDPSVSGGTLGYIFNWSDGSSGTTNANLLAGNYSLLVTDANGCTFTEQYDITEPTTLILATSFSNVLCFGESTGSAEVQATGATPGYTYAWNNTATTSVISDLPTGNYNVTVTDDLGCTEVASVFIDQPVASLSATYLVTLVDCFGNGTGAVDMTPAGGTTPYNYTWATSGSVILSQSTEDLVDLVTDTYLLTLTDDNGCILNSSVFVDQPAAPLSISGTTTEVLCFGGNNATIDITVLGGTQNYTYAWDNGSVVEDPALLTAGTYGVVVTDANGCQISDSYTITEPLEPLVATIELSPVTCMGGNDGYALSEVSGGTGAYSYDWSDGTTMENAYNLVAGTYTLTVTDGNGCTAFTGGDILEPTTIVDLIYIVNDVLCFGGSDGQISMTPFGGTAPYYYNWGNQNDILLSEDGEILSGLTMGVYLIRVIDANGCIHEETIVVNEPTLLETSNTSVDVLCFGDTTGTADAVIWGGTAPYTSVWSNGDLTEDASNLGAGWHYYEVTDDHGCTANDSAVIFQPDQVMVTSHSVAHVTCIDQADGFLEIIVEGGVSPYTYLWSNGSTSDYIENLEAGWYNVIYSDDNSCSDTVYYFIETSSNSCIEIPNTITPNGDNYNDTWFIENMHLYPDAEVVIFNKWGNELFRSEGGYEEWDGNVNGQPLPSEVYYYIILLNNDEADKFTGTITIIR